MSAPCDGMVEKHPPLQLGLLGCTGSVRQRSGRLAPQLRGPSRRGTHSCHRCSPPRHYQSHQQPIRLGVWPRQARQPTGGTDPGRVTCGSPQSAALSAYLNGLNTVRSSLVWSTYGCTHGDLAARWLSGRGILYQAPDCPTNTAAGVQQRSSFSSVWGLRLPPFRLKPGMWIIRRC